MRERGGEKGTGSLNQNNTHNYNYAYAHDEASNFKRVPSESRAMRFNLAMISIILVCHF